MSLITLIIIEMLLWIAVAFAILVTNIRIWVIKLNMESRLDSLERRGGYDRERIDANTYRSIDLVTQNRIIMNAIQRRMDRL